MSEITKGCQLKGHCQPADCPCPMMQKNNPDDVDSDEFVTSVKTQFSKIITENAIFLPNIQSKSESSLRIFSHFDTEKPLEIPLRI